MSQGITFKDITGNRALDPFSVWEAYLPYKWVTSLNNAVIQTLGGLCGSQPMGQLGNAIIKIMIWIFFFGTFWIITNVFVRFIVFWIASLVRLITGVGGKEGLLTSAWYFTFYTAIFCLVYVPWILPYFTYYSGWDEILHWLKVI
jgi:hypothetical protein